MKNNISKILLTSLLTLAVGACSNGGGEATTSGDPTSSGPTSIDPSHTHDYDEHGLCYVCGAFAGETEDISESATFSFENISADQPYFGRVVGLDKSVKYSVDYTSTESDIGAVFKTWGTDDDVNFTSINLLSPSGAINYSKVYLSYTPAKSGYDISLSVVDSNVDAVGYHANGHYSGTDLVVDQLSKDFLINSGTTYYRAPANKDDVYYFTIGDVKISSRFYFYTRTQEGVITKIDESVGMAFKMPEAPDGYLYIVAKTFFKRSAPVFGLINMLTNMGHCEGKFFGHELTATEELDIPALKADQRYFFKFNTYKNHNYLLNNIDFYSQEEIAWYGYNGTSYDKYNGFLKVEVDAEGKYKGVKYDYFVVVLEPKDDKSNEFAWYSVAHDGTVLDDMQVCKTDGIFAGTEVESVIQFNYGPGEINYYRAPIKSGKQYKLVYSLWYGFYTVSFYVANGEHTYQEVTWEVIETPEKTETKPQVVNSTDGYLYFKFDGKDTGDLIYMAVVEVDE